MEDLIKVNYPADGTSILTDKLGMREMQRRAFLKRNDKFILIKSPPSSGKSRALMYIALDKLKNKNISRIIVAVPERSIASSFAEIRLTETGFHSNWIPSKEFNLCLPGYEKKIDLFLKFFSSNEKIMVCTHSTLRLAYNEIAKDKFNDTLVSIDEFHHISSDVESRLGGIVRDLMFNSNTHILAMTGTYFRGDRIPILEPKDEAKFSKVTYNVYEQLKGYKYLKSLGVGFHFYTGVYTDSLEEVLDVKKKTIIHIPHPRSGESTKDKLREVDLIIDLIGEVVEVDKNNILIVKTKNNKKIRVADLVNDNPKHREKIIAYLRNIKFENDIDIIIALGMAKEGFDWPFCENTLTVSYRGSLTEIIQIIGRCTRDSPNKSHAQFINLVAFPEIENNLIVESVNNMIKAITASLLMEQILVPNLNFKPFILGEKNDEPETIHIKGLKKTTSERVENIIRHELIDIKAEILQDQDIKNAIPLDRIDTEVINKFLIPKVIRKKYPNLEEDDIEIIRQNILCDTILKNPETKIIGKNKYIKIGSDFITISDVNIDLIDSVNPFRNVFEILSKSFDKKMLRTIQNTIQAFKIDMTQEEAIILWPKVKEFIEINKRNPDIHALDPKEKRLAETITFLVNLKQELSFNEE